MTGDLPRRDRLLFDRAGNIGREIRQLLDGSSYRFHGGDRFLAGPLDRQDLTADLFSGIAGLGGQGFHLAGDNCKTLTRISGAGRFDRR